MKQNKINRIAENLKENVLLEEKVDFILAKYERGEINEDEALKLLNKLQADENRGFLSDFKDDWKELSKVIDKSEKKLTIISGIQFIIAVIELPVLLIILLFFKFDKINNYYVLIIVSSIIFSVIIHTFFLLRINQQFITALDRIVEKRLGILFLKLTSNTKLKNLNAQDLLEAGTKMFLGHHSKPAEPLNSEDIKNIIQNGRNFNSKDT